MGLADESDKALVTGMFFCLFSLAQTFVCRRALPCVFVRLLACPLVCWRVRLFGWRVGWWVGRLVACLSACLPAYLSVCLSVGLSFWLSSCFCDRLLAGYFVSMFGLGERWHAYAYAQA